MSRINETRHIIWHETCKCLCRLSASVCNSRERWNEDKCRCECKELVDKRICDKEFISNPSNCECECNKPCGIGEYLDYKNCVCRNSVVDKLVENALELLMRQKLYNETLNATPLNTTSSSDCVSSPYIVLFGVFLVTSAFVFKTIVFKKRCS